MDMLEKYKVVAFRYEKQLMERDDVIGVMHLGGIARNRADEDSDIDIAVFSYEPLKDLKLGEQLSEEGYDVEIFNIAINEGFDWWDPIMREAYEEGYVPSTSEESLLIYEEITHTPPSSFASLRGALLLSDRP